MSDVITERDVLTAITQIASSALRREGHHTQGQVTITSAVMEASEALRHAGLILPPVFREAEHAQ